MSFNLRERKERGKDRVIWGFFSAVKKGSNDTSYLASLHDPMSCFCFSFSAEFAVLS